MGSLEIVRQITTLSDADETFVQEQFNVFPGGDTFENIDFSYGQFWHSSFTNAVFGQRFITQQAQVDVDSVEGVKLF